MENHGLLHFKHHVSRGRQDAVMSRFTRKTYVKSRPHYENTFAKDMLELSRVFRAH